VSPCDVLLNDAMRRLAFRGATSDVVGLATYDVDPLCGVFVTSVATRFGGLKEWDRWFTMLHRRSPYSTASRRKDIRNHIVWGKPRVANAIKAAMSYIDNVSLSPIPEHQAYHNLLSVIVQWTQRTRDVSSPLFLAGYTTIEIVRTVSA
jgi:hypothetical protein